MWAESFNGKVTNKDDGSGKIDALLVFIENRKFEFHDVN